MHKLLGIIKSKEALLKLHSPFINASTLRLTTILTSSVQLMLRTF